MRLRQLIANMNGVRPASETQNLWPPFDHSGKCGADCWGYSCLSCPRCGAISTLERSCGRRHGRGMGSPLFLLPCHRPLGRRTNSWHSLRFLHGRRNRESRGLAPRPPVAVRTSSFFWSADGEDLHAKGSPDCHSDYVVCGSDVFRRYPHPVHALGVALGHPEGKVIFSAWVVLGGRNVGEQLDEPRWRLFQGSTRSPQSMSDRVHVMEESY
jgi:hypothetical protein